MLEWTEWTHTQRSALPYYQCVPLISPSISHQSSFVGYYTLSDIPCYPYVAGFQNVTWGSDLCGTCWELTFRGKSVDVLVVDYTVVGFSLGPTAYQALTNQTGQPLGNVEATYEQVDDGLCGL